VRVRLKAATRSVRLSGEALRVEGQPVPGGEVLVVAAPGGGVRAGELVRRGPLRFEASREIRVAGAALPGDVTVISRAEGALDVVNVVPLEAYVERVVASEMYPSWPAEALKAQAVVARTYALFARERSGKKDFDLEGSILSQRYAPGALPRRARDATRAARSEFLAYEGEPILAAFHMSAGGQTAAAEEVWGEALPYLRGVPSPDEDCPDHYWSYDIALEDLRSALAESGIEPGGESEVEVLERTSSGRVGRIRIAGRELSGVSLRELLGGRAIRSTLFDTRVRGDRALFMGSGAGHGVGLSQWGARKMALDGRGYREILAHYFPGSELLSLASPASEGGGP
jgi:stage II sporulation protein D